MLKNYLKTTFRNLLKNKAFSAINILGLAIGIASTLLITHYVRFERSYENFNDQAENVFRVTIDLYNGSEFIVNDAETYQTLGPEFKATMPEVLDYARFMHVGTAEFYAPSTDTRSYEHGVYLADPSAFSIFKYPLLYGDPAQGFEQPFKAVIDEKTAIKYFGETNVIGKTIELNIIDTPVEIVAVMKDLPQNTHLKFDMLISHSTIPKVHPWYEKYPWGGNNEYTYLLMDESANVADFNVKLKEYSLANEHVEDEIFISERITDIHLYSNKTFEPEVNGSAQTVNFMSLLGVFILILAWVNYINLSTAKSLERAKEVGVRKVVGSSKGQLIVQFLFDSFMINLLAGVLAFTIVQLSVPYFREVTGQDLSLSIFGDSAIIALLATIILVGTLLSGLYPAFVLSSFKPVAVLKGRFLRSARGNTLRKALVIFQFLTTVVLISISLTVYQQVNFLSSSELGVKIDNTLVLRIPGTDDYDSVYRTYTSAMEHNLEQLSLVKSVTLASAVPGASLHEVATSTGIKRVEADEKEGSYNYYVIAIQPDYFEVMGVEMVAGKSFPGEIQNRNNKVIINEKAVETLGFASAESAIGQKITYYHDGKPSEVIGVMRNFYQRSPKEQHIPMVLHPYMEEGVFIVKLNTQNTRQALTAVSDQWSNIYPNNALDYYFLDDAYNHQYLTEKRFGQVTVLFTILSVVIAALGLFGLSYFTILQRTKEIGIRKVLGASIRGIVQLLSKDFLKLVMLSGFLAIPIAYYFIELWLQNYANHIDIEWWLFAIPLVLILVIALSTIIGQTLRSAFQNPVNSLRHE